MNASPGPEKEEKKGNIYMCILGLAEMESNFLQNSLYGAWLTPALRLLLRSACTASLIKPSLPGPTSFLTFSLPVPVPARVGE